MSHQIGYCTNVHAGVDLDTAQGNLERYACSARTMLGDDRALGIGLWLADEAARQTLVGKRLDDLKRWLEEHRLHVFTMNGFPQGNFHQKIVKHRVYEPTWWSPSRLDYTRSLVHILASLIDEGDVGSISTLPISWGSPAPSHQQLTMAAEQLKTLGRELAELYEATGKEIVLAIEPEPGCHIGCSSSLRTYFESYLLGGGNEKQVKKYLTVCHDVCHAAVMREDQKKELGLYRELGLRIGKVQVSSAIQVDWNRRTVDERRAAFQQLASFAEDKYLHQTSICIDDAEMRLVEDLPQLLAEVEDPSELSGSWRVHFHVPIFALKLGAIDTTQSEIQVCLESLRDDEALCGSFTGHWEIETYAWSVIPKEFAPSDLAAGIASEIRWFEEQW